MWLRSQLVSSVELEEAATTDAASQPLSSTSSTVIVGSKRSAEEAGVGGVVSADLTAAYLVETDAPIAADMRVLATAPEDVVEVSRCVVIARSCEHLEQAEPGGANHKTILYFFSHRRWAACQRPWTRCTGTASIYYRSARTRAISRRAASSLSSRRRGTSTRPR